MTKQEIDRITKLQKDYFLRGNTFDVSVRKNYLYNLRAAICENEGKICDALQRDLGKSARESYMCEIGLTLDELSYQIKHIDGFCKPVRVKTPISQFRAKSYRYPSPYGTVLILSPWNYPFLLSMEPLVEAIAAGNTVVLKPSNYSLNTTVVMRDILSEVFPQEMVAVIEGGREENAVLFETRFDYIFFTGSKTVGRLCYKSAAEYLTPITLELGGKSPCIVDETAKIPLAARRIVFGKFLNAGQTCVAPDYIFVHSSVKEKFIDAVKAEIAAQFGSEPLKNPSYGKIITEKHFARLIPLIDKDKIVYGGGYNEKTLKIEPTVLDGVTFSDPCMQDEIFGPIMPVIAYDDINAVINYVNTNSSPLALYYFTENHRAANYVIKNCRFGGGCVNDVVIHLATSHMPFGGFGESGLGSYHGKQGFDTFTHYKSIVDKATFIDLKLRYQPYKQKDDKIIRKFLK